MSEETVLESVLLRLDRYGIKYMLTGSVASNFHGPPRSTQDANVVIEANEQSLRQFVVSLSEEFYADADSAIDALKTRFMFNIIHYETGFKIDFIVPKPEPYSALAFDRRVKGKLSKIDGWFASAEDLILSKLQWHKMSESSRQLEDAIQVAKLQRDRLDIQYLKKWALQLEVDDLLDNVLVELKIMM